MACRWRSFRWIALCRRWSCSSRRIDEFDLNHRCDRYKRRGILPTVYLDNIRRYVESGGAVLVAAGPDFAGADSIYRSPLSEILPASPTAQVIEEGFVPGVTELGTRHPVTEGLEEFAPRPQGEDGAPGWGRWFRLIDLAPKRGQVVMTALGERPLLVLDRVGEGRVALLGSDHAWLWNRGYEGGGPQLELLRRLAHWMMKEPELEEEALTADAQGQTMRILRRTLDDGAGDVTVTAPDGSETVLELEQVAPGRFEALWEAPEIGLYRLSDGELDTVIGVGPAAPREFVQTIASGAALTPVVDSWRGGVMRLEEGFPSLRDVRPGRPAAGRGWVGLTPRDAYTTADVQLRALLPAWAFLLLASALALGAWLREGRR